MIQLFKEHIHFLGSFLAGLNKQRNTVLCSNVGKTYLILGRAAADWGMGFDLSGANASFVGEDSSDRSGSSVASAGDVNDDGSDDLLIGAYQNDDAGFDAGQTYLVLGNTTVCVATSTGTGTACFSPGAGIITSKGR